MKKFLLICLSVISVLIGIYLLSKVEMVPVKVQCIEVAHASCRHGDLHRYHYLKYPDGHIKTVQGGYYQQGKYYTKHEALNPNIQGVALFFVLGGLFTFISGICWIFFDR